MSAAWCQRQNAPWTTKLSTPFRTRLGSRNLQRMLRSRGAHFLNQRFLDQTLQEKSSERRPQGSTPLAAKAAAEVMDAVAEED